MNQQTGIRSRRPAPQRAATLAAGLALTATGWAVMWGVVSFWNPLAFAALWTGAALVMWSASPAGYPGLRRHIALAVASVPVWWWFELVNTRVQNWEYVHPFDPSVFWFALLSSVAFATVVPAITSATDVLRRFTGGHPGLSAASVRFAWFEVAAGLVLQGLVFAFPVQMYPCVWVAPFLVVDGAAALLTGRSMGADILRGRWREAAVIGAAGLFCGVLWEFWNYWSTPHWEYSVPLLGFWNVFEMPLLGYGGYVPFAWSIVRLVHLLDALQTRAERHRSGYRRETGVAVEHRA